MVNLPCRDLQLWAARSRRLVSVKGLNSAILEYTCRITTFNNNYGDGIGTNQFRNTEIKHFYRKY